MKKPHEAARSTFFSALLSSLKHAVADGTEKALDYVEERVLLLQKRLLRNLFIAACVAAGTVLLVLAAWSYVIDALGQPRYLAFFVAGALLLVVASVRANFK